MCLIEISSYNHAIDTEIVFETKCLKCNVLM